MAVGRLGPALTGFIKGTLANTAGDHPDVQGWHAAFLQDLVLPHAAFWRTLVSSEETLVGMALILGLFTGIPAFFGSFMNANYLLAGAVSTNPILFALATWLVLAWKIGGCGAWVGGCCRPWARPGGRVMSVAMKAAGLADNPSPYPLARAKSASYRSRVARRGKPPLGWTTLRS